MELGLNATYISPALERKLDKISECLVTTIIAAAGYGKTRAIRWWYDHNINNENTIILNMTVMRDSLSEFWNSFCSCFEEWEDTYDSLKSLGFPAEPQLMGIMKEILHVWFKKRKDSRIYLIIDDLHFITNPLVSDLLFNVITGFEGYGVHTDVHFVLISRNTIFNHAERIKFGAELNDITMDDLKLDCDNIIRYAQNGDITLDREEASMLERVTEGWFSVIYLNLSAWQRNHMWLNGNDNIYTIMDDVLFKPISDREAEFLSILGVPDEFTSEEAWWVWQEDDTRDILQKLSSNNAFISKLADGTYRYHNMLKKCAMTKFNKLPDETRSRVYLRFGKWYENNLDLVKAEKYYIKCEAWDELLDCFVIGQGRTVIGENIERFLKWEKECPRDIMLRHPVALLTIMKVLFSFGQMAEMIEIKKLLARSLEENSAIDQTEKNNLLGESELIMGFTAYNDIKAMSSFHRRAAELMTRDALNTDSKGSWTFGSPSVLWMFHKDAGGLDAENDAMFECMPFYYKVTNSHGNGAEYAMLSAIHFHRGDVVKAQQTAEIALAAAKLKGQLSIRISAEFVQMHIQMLNGDFASIRKLIETTRKSVLQDRQYNLIYTMDMVDAWMNSFIGESCVAADWLTNDSTGSPLPKLATPMIAIVRNQLSLLGRNYAEIVARQQTAFGVCRGLHAGMCELYLHLQLASAYEAMGQDDLARAELRQALDFTMPDGIVMPFLLFYKKFFTTAFEALSTEDEYSEYCRKIMKLADDLKSGHKPVTGTDKKEANTANGLKALLTEREYKIATLAAHRMTNKEIATQMFLAEGTVRNQLSKVFEKLDIEGDTRNKRMELEKLFGK